MYLDEKDVKTADRECTPRLRSVWMNMIQRCHNPKHRQYRYYGGRGITVCDEWRNDYLCFREWALKNGYVQGLTIDRINNNDGYSPQNCRWTTHKEQNRNRRSNHNITLNGETKCLTEWAEINGLSVPTVRKRLKDGWSTEDALSVPVHTRGKALRGTGKTMEDRIRDAAKVKGISIHKLEQIAGIANGIICKVGDGSGIRISTIVKIAKALDVSTDYLLGVTEEP